ncbi:MAG: hypothetical protein KDJ98_04140 [Rhodobacteraceae bacterium]|nr:hypothetical protein [Paracoccaceae bacterium]
MAELLASMRRDRFHAHVLALPVDTAIARMRGVHACQRPKWLATIELTLGDDVRASTTGTDGAADLTLRTPIPVLTQVAPQSQIGTSVMVNRVDGRGQQTSVLSNTLTLGQTMLPRDVTLTRSGGPLSQLLDGLGARRMLRFDVVKDTQIVLNLPVPLPEGRVRAG